MSELPPTAHVQRTFADVSNVPCMDGARGARGNLAVVRSVRVQPCIRPCMGLFLSRGLRRVVHLLSFVGFCSICRPFLLSRPAFHSVGARRGWLAVLTTFSAIARPDRPEHGGALDAVGMTIRGELAIGRGSSRHNLVFGRSIRT